MKRKSLLLVFTGACIFMMLAGCTGDVSAEVEPAEEQEIVIAEVEPEAGAEEVIEAEVEPEVEEEVPEEPEVDPNVELSMQFLEADEEWLIENNTLGFERDGKIYSLAYYVPVENRDKSSYGVYSSVDDEVCVYGIGDTKEDTVVMNDEFVIPHIEATDNVCWFGEDGTSSITLLSVDSYGYTVPLLIGSNNISLVLDYSDFQSGNNVRITDYRDKDVCVVDTAGKTYSDIRSLNQGETYKICWTDNGDHEQEMTANAVYYKANGESISIEGQITDDPNKVSFDLSSLPAGTYFCVESEGLFTVE